MSAYALKNNLTIRVHKRLHLTALAYACPPTSVVFVLPSLGGKKFIRKCRFLFFFHNDGNSQLKNLIRNFPANKSNLSQEILARSFPLNYPLHKSGNDREREGRVQKDTLFGHYMTM